MGADKGAGPHGYERYHSGKGKMSENDIFSRWFGSEYDMYNRMKDQASHRGYDKSYERERPSDMEYESERLEEIYERQRARDAMLRRRNNQRAETEDGPACKRETSCEDISNYFFPERTSKNCAQEVSWGVTKCKCQC